MKHAAVLLLLLAVSTACGAKGEGRQAGTQPGPTTSAVEVTSTDVTGSWELVSGTGPEGEIGIVEHNRITFGVDAEGNAGGRSACNWYGNAKWAEGKGLEGDIFLTAMGCRPNVQASETGFIAAIAAVKQAARNGGQLVLTGRATELTFKLLEPVSTEGLLDRRWTLVEVIDGGVSSLPVGEPATFRAGNDGSLAWTTGCAEYKGTFIESGDELDITSFELLEPEDPLQCPADVRRQDEIVGRAMGGAFRPTVNGDRLEISSASSDARAIYRVE